LQNVCVTATIGTLLSDRYRLDAQVGSGGMSTVYRAFDTVLERPVAIKLMHRDIAQDGDQLERFRREARAVAQINHPHVVGVIDAGEDDGMPYIVLEFVAGETLKSKIKRLGPLSIGEAVAYAIEIARALQAAHERQIVHRDVKPQNVLIDAEGSAKVTDFGIARTLDQDGLTADGRVLGTTDYVAPEQALGHEVGPQSDIYSLGVVLFEMLTGAVPFVGENQVAVAMKHVREELPDVRQRRPEVSAALAAVLDRATEKEASRRYSTADALIADLEEALTIETARSGQAPGEVTAVLRTLPAQARERLPWRNRVGVGLLLGMGIGALILIGTVVFFTSENTQRGTGSDRSDVAAPPDLREVQLGQDRAKDYDPLGDQRERPEKAALVLDGNRQTVWQTETYAALDLQKPGVGLYVDAKPDVDAARLELTTPTPGFAAEIYVARDGEVPDTLPDSRWQQVGSISAAKRTETVDLDTAGNRFRYYLVWITRLPPGQGRVEISEIVLRAPR
jgi:eukaryotic-like serine/threonine-protein kinase